MGLAASQARFLAITSRKARCEFESMQIAQQKLSLTRELEQATSDYQASLNQSTLIWDPDGSGETPFDVTYDLLMRPSDVNDYMPFLLSRRDGRIALSSSMAQAAKAAGINEDGSINGTKQDVYMAFLDAMVATGGMSETAARSAKAIGLNESAGLGGELLDKTTATEMTLGNMINYIDLKANIDPSYATDAEKEVADALNITIGSKDSGALEIKSDLQASSNYLVINGTKQSNDGSEINFTLSDLLTEDVTFAFTSEKNSTSFWKKIVAAVGSVLSGTVLFGGYNGLLNLLGVDQGGYSDMTPQERQLLEILDNMFKGFEAILDTSQSEIDVTAFNYAIQETLNLLANTQDLGSRNHSNDAFNDAINEANNYNGFVTKAASKNKNFGTTAISLSNLAESFLTFYAQAKGGFQDDYYIRQDGKKSSYVTDDQGYYYRIKNGDDGTSKQMFEAEFYSIMFNNILENGWYNNLYIDDKEYLDNALKNGQLFITSINEDGYYYQDRYNANGYIMEDTDDDAITQAEREFSAVKLKIEAKEQQLDLDMKNLDLEISSLTTEYDTVKSLINKNVEKTFTMFQS
ncbi:unknown [Brachyspira sp. CAG:484]|nr:unknown [Brachyspira sp. CAG:484]DAH07837.1 MAG TPA: hypothetical protein [Caudoviricetes sp.]